MAFAFGSSTPGFGAPPAASSGGFSFGAAAASTPGFGAPTSTPAFGAQAASSPAFNFGGAAPAFGASSAPGFGAAAPSQPLFGGASTPSFGGFGASAPASSGGFFGGGALVPAASSAPAAAPFGAFGAAPGAGAAAPTAGQASGALTYSSKFEDLPAQVQQAFNQLQQQVSQYDSDRTAVSQTPHLQEAPNGGRDVGAEADALRSELRSLQGSMRSEEEALANFREKAVQLLKAADSVVRSFQRTKLWRDAPTQFKGQVLPTAMQELLSQPVLLPSPFLEEAAGGFAEQVAEFRRTVAEVEQVLAAQSARQAEAAAGAGGVDVALALPTVVANMHDYFTHVAAKLERVHAELQAAKAAHRAALRLQGIHRDPFERAQQQAERIAKARQLAPPLLPPPSGGGGGAGGAAGAPAAAGGALGAPAARSPGGGAFAAGGPGGFGGFGSPFPPGTPGGAFGTPQGAAALGRTTSSKSARPSKSRR